MKVKEVKAKAVKAPKAPEAPKVKAVKAPKAIKVKKPAAKKAGKEVVLPWLQPKSNSGDGEQRASGHSGDRRHAAVKGSRRGF